MDFPYVCQPTPPIQQLLIEIKAMQQAALLLPMPSNLVIANLRTESQLKSAVYSARIEGNPLEIALVQSIAGSEHPVNHHKQEILNLNQALQWIYAQPEKIDISLNLIKKLHELCLNTLGPDSGALRAEPSAVFNEAGVAIYLAPSPDQIRSKLAALFDYLNSSTDDALIRSAMSHFAFEKIHPFLDGNGRVGRLLITVVLRNDGYDLHGLLDLNHYLEKYRQDYYDLLLYNTSNITEFVCFILEGIRQQARVALRELQHKPKKEKPEDHLLPRRQEILAIVRDHEMVSFDFIARRFAAVPVSTLHNDLRQLQNKAFIKKLGSTRGVLYAKS